MEFFQNINEVDLTSMVLTGEENVLVLLVKLSDGLWVNFLFNQRLIHLILDRWREESVSILLRLLSLERLSFNFIVFNEGVFSTLNLRVVKEVLSLFQKLLMLMLESLEFVHGVVTHLLQFFLVLSVNLVLDVFPVLSVHLWFSLNFHSWANNLS